MAEKLDTPKKVLASIGITIVKLPNPYGWFGTSFYLQNEGKTVSTTDPGQKLYEKVKKEFGIDEPKLIKV